MMQNKFKRFLVGFQGALSDLLWPPVCAVCGQGLPLADGQRSLCQPCYNDVEFLPDKICQKCGRPFWGAGSDLCGECVKNPAAYDKARAVLTYSGGTVFILNRLKYHGARHQAKTLASLCAERLLTDLPAFDLVVPMPVSAKRLKERGYNQAYEIAKEIYGPVARNKIKEGLLLRTAEAAQRQAQLGAKDRRAAVRGCFAVKDPALVKGAHVLLFDDVLTTGATAGETARTLLAAGAAKVDLATVARTILDSWRQE